MLKVLVTMFATASTVNRFHCEYKASEARASTHLTSVTFPTRQTTFPEYFGNIEALTLGASMLNQQRLTQQITRFYQTRIAAASR